MRLTRVVHLASKKPPRPSFNPRTFSGIQPTGALHLGNYFGAVQQWVEEVQNSHAPASSRLFSIVDLHAITLPQDPKELRENTLTMAASLIGCGLDTEKAIVFQQSKVHQHTELCWILGCLFTVPNLQRLSQYKDKSKNLKEVPLGLFIYPVLQAADILLYKATHVPVGEDNLQNVEVTRHIARSFNHRFKKEVFPIPSTVLVTEESSRRIRSLRNPEKKMSKSDPDSKSCVYVTDDPDTVLSKVKKAVTDCQSEVTFEPETRPGVSNLVCIHSRVSGKDPEEICKEVSGKDTGQYKLIVAEAIIEHFKPINQNISYLLKNKDHLEHLLSKGSDRATELAHITLTEVQNAVGLK